MEDSLPSHIVTLGRMLCGQTRAVTYTWLCGGICSSSQPICDSTYRLRRSYKNSDFFAQGNSADAAACLSACANYAVRPFQPLVLYACSKLVMKGGANPCLPTSHLRMRLRVYVPQRPPSRA